MSYKTAHIELNRHLESLGLGLDIAYENADYKPTTTASFLAVSLLPVAVESVGKADTDADYYTGIYQVSVYTPSGELAGDSLDIVDKLRRHFWHGRTPENVFIDSFERGPARNVQGWYVIDCSIQWRIFTDRPNGPPGLFYGLSESGGAGLLDSSGAILHPGG